MSGLKRKYKFIISACFDGPRVWFGWAVLNLGLPHGCHQMSATPAAISRLSWTSGSAWEVEGTHMAGKFALAVSRRAQCLSMGASPQAASVISWHGG